MNPQYSAELPANGDSTPRKIAPSVTTQQIDYLTAILANGNERAVRFAYTADFGSKVFIAGTFNGWNPLTHPLEYRPTKREFKAYLLLERGTYEYKFVVNGVWVEDPNCSERVQDGNGGFNSVVRV